jgi:hypothetical protein
MIIRLKAPLVSPGTAEPLRVSPPEAVAYLLELGALDNKSCAEKGRALFRPFLRYIHQKRD